jgi:hypothetical protein
VVEEDEPKPVARTPAPVARTPVARKREVEADEVLLSSDTRDTRAEGELSKSMVAFALYLISL